MLLVVVAGLCAVSANAGGSFEKDFISTDVLSKTELQTIQNHVRSGRIRKNTGAFTVVFHDKRMPLSENMAADFFRNGKVGLVSFSGFLNTLEGSFHLGKLIAKINGAPVLAIHSGYGDAGVFMAGPKAFFLEREAYRPVLNLMKKTPAGHAPEITIYAYCLGAHKAALLGRYLEKSNPALAAKTNLLVLGLGINAPESFKSVTQLAGNIDRFGRINSTNLLVAEPATSKDHTLRLDLPEALRIPRADELPAIRYTSSLRRDSLPDELKTGGFSGQELMKMEELLKRSVVAFMVLEWEAGQTNSGSLTDKIHSARMKLETARAKRNFVRLHAAISDPQSEAGKIAELEKFAGELDLQVASLETKINDLLSQRTNLTDFEEYLAWLTNRISRRTAQ